MCIICLTNNIHCSVVVEMFTIPHLLDEHSTINIDDVDRPLKPQASFLKTLIATSASSIGLIVLLIGIIIILTCAVGRQHRSKYIKLLT